MSCSIRGAMARRSSQRGASLVEYALLLALIAVVCMVSVTFLGTSASGKFTGAKDAIDNTTTTVALSDQQRCVAAGGVWFRGACYYEH